MVLTPWGEASTLRERRLPPGRTRPREEVERNQRERLYAAMVALTAANDYAKVSVADLAELSGVSSRSFYELFADKEACFLAAMEEILGNAARFAKRAIARDGAAEVGAAAIVEMFVGLVAAQPAAARLCIVSAFCAGEKPRAVIDRAVRELASLVEAVSGGDSRMPAEMVQAMLGGVAIVLYRRLVSGETSGLAELAPTLGEWVASVPPPPRQLRAKPKRQRRPNGTPPPFAAYVPSERILRALAAAVTDKGYAATTIADIAARAQISQKTFYNHFRDKHDAFMAAIDSSGAQMVAAVMPVLRRHPTWPEAVRVALEVHAGFLAGEQSFAYLREVEVYAVGPEAVAQRDSSREEVVRLLEASAPPGVIPERIVIEATLGAYQALSYGRVRDQRFRALAELPPLVTYLALAPQMGAEAAWEVACG